jgi:hypothetical protein
VADRSLSEADLRRVVKEKLAAREPGPERAREAPPAPAQPGNPVALDDGMLARSRPRRLSCGAPQLGSALQ